MADELVINTGPLIAFDRMGCLDEIGRLPFVFVCPDEVRHELDEGEAAGHPGIAPSWLAVQKLSSQPPSFGLVELDLGEAAVIQLALEMKTSHVAIDEWKGRRMALAMGLKVVGSLGLLAKAKQLGLVSEVGPFIQRAIDVGIRYHPALVSLVLKELGET